MSAVCQEFVQNAWKKDLCSNCFKARGEHSTSSASACDSKSNVTIDYVTSNRQPIATEHRSNGVTVSVSPQRTQKSVDANNRANEGGAVFVTVVSGSSEANPPQHINNNNNVNNGVTGLRSSPRRVGSNGVHLWEIGQAAPKNGGGDQKGITDKSAEINSSSDEADHDKKLSTNGSPKNNSPPSTTTNGGGSVGCDDVTSSEAKSILKEKVVVVHQQQRRRSSVLFVEESQVIGYGGNDYNWEDQESSEEPSDVDSLENYDASEEERALTDLTTVNTQFNSDNTNLLLSQALNAKNAAAAARRLKQSELNDDHVTLSTANGVTSSTSVPTTMQSAVSIGGKSTTTTTPPGNYYAAHANNSYLHASLQSDAHQNHREQTETNSWNAAQSFIRSNLFDDSSNGLRSYLDDGDSDNDYADSASTSGRRHHHRVQNGHDGDEEESSENEDRVTSPIAAREVVVDSNKWQRRQINCQVDRSVAKQAGSSSVPVKRTPLSGGGRTSVHQLFNEAPVTAAEIKTVTDRLPTLVFRPMGEVAPSNGCSTRKNGREVANGEGCSPYGVVSISQLPPGNMNYSGSYDVVPEVPSSPPPASDDETQKTLINPKNHPATSPTNGFGGGFYKKSPMSNGHPIHQSAIPEETDHQRSLPPGCSTFKDGQGRSREYAAVNYSCHYASSYLPTGNGNGTVETNGKKALSPVTHLPPTPLTNPYSSTEILKGIPPATSPPLSPTGKPPVTKPKPKLPIKPTVKPKSPDKMESTNGRNSAELPAENAVTPPPTMPEQPMPTVETTRVIHRSSAYYQEIDAESSDNEQLSEKEAKTPTRSPGVESTKIKTPKRPAPRPPGTTATITKEEALYSRHHKGRTPTDTPTRTSLPNRSSQPSNSDNGGDVSPTKSGGQPVTPIRQPSPPSSMSKSNSGSTSALLNVTSRELHDQHDGSLNGPESYTGSPYRSFSSLTAATSTSTTGSYSLIQNPSLSKSSSSSSSINGSDYYSFKESAKEGKSKKSKFSLKKLLKFARDDGGDGSGKSKGKWSLHGGSSSGVGYERKTKLEIIHPFDLIAANAQTDMGSLSPSISESSSKCSTFKSSPVEPTYDRLAKTEVDRSFQRETPTNPQTPSPDTDAENASDFSARSRPPPPPRNNRGHNDDAAPVEKQGCPTSSPAKQQRNPRTHKQAEQSVNDSHESNGNVVYRDHGNQHNSQQNGENRNSCYSSNMEYANLGDIRNSVAPKKPERCSSTSAMDLVAHDHIHKSLKQTNSNDTEKNTVVHSEKITYNNDVTYYAPPEDNNWRSDTNSDVDELYVDQSNNVSDQSQPSSFTSDSLSTNSSTSNTRPLAANFRKQNGGYAARENGGAINGKRDSAPVNGTKEIGDTSRCSAPNGSLDTTHVKSTNGQQHQQPQQPPEPSSPSITLNDTDESSEVGAFVWPRKKASRLSLRKTKTVVHKNLEDNYGAVVTANHQTLSQILEQVSVTQQETTSKVGLLKDVPLHYSDFTVLEDSKVIIDGQKAFYSAVWQQNLEVTLLVSQEPLCSTAQTIRNSCVCVPLAEFEDAIPINLFSKTTQSLTCGDFCRGTIWVMERMRVETVAGISQLLTQQTDNDVEAYEREVCFILLQIINGLKHLQMLGIEEVDDNVSDFIFTMKNNDVNYRLVILPKASSQADGHRGSIYAGAQEKFSLCQGALVLMLKLLKADAAIEYIKAGSAIDAECLPVTPNLNAFRLFADVLSQERATSLSQVKMLLENMLWGPTDLEGNSPATTPSPPGKFGPDQDQVYQRWLDLERSMTLNNLIRTQSLWQIRLTVYEEYMLSFLVRTCAKTLREAASQLQIANRKK